MGFEKGDIFWLPPNLALWMPQKLLPGKTKTFSLTSTRALCHGDCWTSSLSPMMLRIVLLPNWRLNVASKPSKNWLRCLQTWPLVINFKKNTWGLLIMAHLGVWPMKSESFKPMPGQRRQMMLQWCRAQRCLAVPNSSYVSVAVPCFVFVFFFQSCFWRPNFEITSQDVELHQSLWDILSCQAQRPETQMDLQHGPFGDQVLWPLTSASPSGLHVSMPGTDAVQSAVRRSSEDLLSNFCMQNISEYIRIWKYEIWSIIWRDFSSWWSMMWIDVIWQIWQNTLKYSITRGVTLSSSLFLARWRWGRLSRPPSCRRTNANDRWCP